MKQFKLFDLFVYSNKMFNYMSCIIIILVIIAITVNIAWINN